MYPVFNPNKIALTPFLFFTGKGGVGKTSTACATAVSLADQGKKVLLVSTDPASNLQDVLDVELTNDPIAIPSVNNLFACNIDPEASAKTYREQVVGPYRGKLPDAVLATMEEQLSGACTVEIAAFDEFSHLLSDEDVLNQYDHVLFDTAPTGHTLRLLQLPTAWTGFLEESTHGASCLGPLSGLGEKKELYAKAVESLSNPEKTTSNFGFASGCIFFSRSKSGFLRAERDWHSKSDTYHQRASSDVIDPMMKCQHRFMSDNACTERNARSIKAGCDVLPSIRFVFINRS